MAQIHLEVVTPSGAVISEEVDIVTAPGVSGEFGVLANHAPFLSTIKTGTLSYKKDRLSKYLMVTGGFAEVSNNKITFLVESAEFGNEIDVDRAIRAWLRHNRPRKRSIEYGLKRLCRGLSPACGQQKCPATN